jgi:hypothetical protein
MLVMRGNRLFQATNLGHVRSLHQERFGGKTQSTSPIVTCSGGFKIFDKHELRSYNLIMFCLSI